MRKLKGLVILVLAVLLAYMPAVSVAESGADGDAPPAPGGPASVTAKDEVIYARLSSGGDVQNVYAVNHFTLSSGGVFSDYGDYSGVINLTDLYPLTVSDGEVSAQTESENFYYQGNLTGNSLPWLYTAEYLLDGAVIRPEELAGRDGRLEIRLKSAKNGGVNETFYNHYMQQITVTLDTDICANVAAKGASVAGAGKNRVLVFTILPGQNADITVTSDVRDFETAGIDITAVPYAMNIELPEGIPGDFSLLPEALAELNDGAGKLKNGAAEMASGLEKLKDGSSAFNGGLSRISANAVPITDASAQINDALALMSSSLSGAGGLTDMNELGRLPAALAQLADGLDKISGGIKQLKDAYAPAYAALDKAVAEIPDYNIGEEQMYGLYAKADDDERALLGQLMESYAAAVTVKGVYGQVKTAFALVGPSLDTVSASVGTVSAALREMYGQIGGLLSGGEAAAQIELLSAGISELSKNYAAFHNGLVLYNKGIAELAGGYSEIDGGVAKSSDGAAEISKGVSALSDGTGRLAAETADMPQRIQEQIDGLMGEYANSEFEAVSFMSERNKNIEFVQFVFKIEGIKKPAAVKNTAPETKQPGFWERLTGLFGK